MRNVHILTVFPRLKHNQADLVEDVIETDFRINDYQVFVDKVSSESDALARIFNNAPLYHLLITCLDIPISRKDNKESNEKSGIALLGKVRDSGRNLPCIIISDHITHDLKTEIDDLDNCHFLEVSAENFSNDLLYSCKKLLASQELDPVDYFKKRCGIVHIYLRSNGPCQYRMDGTYFYPMTPLNFHPNIEDLGMRSEEVAKENKKWEDRFRYVGLDLLKELFEQNPTFYANFSTLIETSGGKENIKIRFEVDEDVYPLALEALVAQDKEYYRLHSPLYRTVPYGSTKPPLFKDLETREKNINCLIIEADAEGPVSEVKDEYGEDIILEKLKNLPLESKNFVEYLGGNNTRFKIDAVERLVLPEKEPEGVMEILNNTLNRKFWHLIHFAGHSYYNNDSKKAYVFLPGEVVPYALEADDFARSLRQANPQFLYISSCKSSQSKFVFELAKQGIPAILGFRWKIDDVLAAKHAKIFYEELFEKKKWLEYAFLETIKRVKWVNKGNPIWAAAMLVIQDTS